MCFCGTIYPADARVKRRIEAVHKIPRKKFLTLTAVLYLRRFLFLFAKIFTLKITHADIRITTS